jgi:tetratricopeptide (TPR) repeat protein
MREMSRTAGATMAANGAPSAVQQARWERLVMRRPGLALPRLQRWLARSDAAGRQALLGAFFVLERWGRGPELQAELEAALAQARAQQLLAEAAELSEALGRLHYQRGDYVQACKAWSQALELAEDETRCACLARIGLAHLCFALGDWARGGRVLDQAELHDPRLGSDPYLRAKIALNRAVSLRVTQGPQAALAALDQARAAAREAGHRDYEAEAIWQHARCARDSGAPDQALQLAQRALDLAQRCSYRWLQAQALLLISELQQGEAALLPVQQALALGEALQSRALQAAAHGRLGQLMQARGELGPSWHHQQQRQRLEATLGQTELPARLEALARFDTDPHGADALLLSLGEQAWPLHEPADLARSWAQWRPRLLAALDLSELQLWWAPPGGEPGPVGPQGSEAAATSRLSLPLSVQGRAAGELHLLRPQGAGWSRADEGRAKRLAALLERWLVALEPAAAAPAEPRRRARAAGLAEAERVAARGEAQALLAGLEQLPPSAALQPLLAQARALLKRLGA